MYRTRRSEVPYFVRTPYFHHQRTILGTGDCRLNFKTRRTPSPSCSPRGVKRVAAWSARVCCEDTQAYQNPAVDQIWSNPRQPWPSMTPSQSAPYVSTCGPSRIAVSNCDVELLCRSPCVAAFEADACTSSNDPSETNRPRVQPLRSQDDPCLD